MAYALLGYPMEPVKVEVVRVEKADSHTDAICILSDDTRIFRSLVYANKPRRVRVKDQYGTITRWQGKPY